MALVIPKYRLHPREIDVVCFRRTDGLGTVFASLRGRAQTAVDPSGSLRKDVELPLGSIDFSKREGTSGTAGKEAQSVRFSLIVNPSEGTVNTLVELWQTAWRWGVDQDLACAGELRELMFAGRDRIASMHKHSFDNIPIATVWDPTAKRSIVVGAIWGQQLDLPAGEFPPALVGNYGKATAKLTFDNRDPQGNSLLCVSVAVTDAYNRLVNAQGLSIGRQLVQTELRLAVQHPYLTRIFAYSRPSSLTAFVELISAIKADHGYEINYDETKSWQAVKGQEALPVVISSEGVLIGNTLYAAKKPRNSESYQNVVIVPPWKVTPSEQGFLLAPPTAEKVFTLIDTDGHGVFTMVGGHKKYLVPIRAYLEETKFDQMVEFHGGRGGKIMAILPHGRRLGETKIEDPIALGYNIVFEFPVAELINKYRLAEELFSILDRDQQEFIRLALSNPQQVLTNLAGMDPKTIYLNAFSVEKAALIVQAMMPNIDHLRTAAMERRFPSLVSAAIFQAD